MTYEYNCTVCDHTFEAQQSIKDEPDASCPTCLACSTKRLISNGSFVNKDDLTQKLIFFVGPDRCGKTEISNAVSRALGIPYFKATSEHTSFLSSRVSKDDQFLNQLRFADPRVFDILRQTGHSVVFDRGFPCEFAYAKVMGRETDMKMIEHMDEAYASLGAKIVFCHRSSYMGIQDDLDPTIKWKTLGKLHEAYNEFASWTKCKMLKLNVDDENLDREVAEVIKFIGETQ